MEYPLPDKAPAPKPLLRLEKIRYSLDNVLVLRDINLDVYASEFHAVVGDHGSGKSSLGMIIGGLTKPSSGRIIFNDKPYSFFTHKKAQKLNVQMVCQDIQLINYFTVAENLFMPDNVYHLFPFSKKKRLVRKAERLLVEHGLAIDPLATVNSLPISDRMVVHILRSIYKDPELLILDAVLEKLAPVHLEKIFDLLKVLKQSGTTILCIAHSIDDIYNLADKVTIIRNGKVILTDTIHNIDRMNLIKLCYTQIAVNGDIENYHDFYQLLRYNEAILQKLPINLLVTDNENRIKLINDHGKKYFGIDQKASKSLRLDDLFSPGNKPALDLIKSAFQEKSEKTFYNVPVTIDDNQNVTNIKTLPIHDGPFLIGNITIIEDVSKQEKLRQQVVLSEKLASVGILAAGVAHEINNPLEIIYNHLNFMKFNIDKKKLYESIAHIEEELNDIKHIVSNLISFSDSNKIVNDEFELNRLISSIINLINFSARKKSLHIDFTPAEEPIYLNANANEIKQVVLNLIKNSFEASAEGGEIFIKTERTGSEAHPLACITFRDKGLGIEDENTDNIFLPFYSTKKGNDLNLGLGLSVSYGILKKYSGNISVKNLPDCGCEFTITIPQK